MPHMYVWNWKLKHNGYTHKIDKIHTHGFFKGDFDTKINQSYILKKNKKALKKI